MVVEWLLFPVHDDDMLGPLGFRVQLQEADRVSGSSHTLDDVAHAVVELLVGCGQPQVIVIVDIRIGRDQNDREYFAGIEYLGKEPDSENDPDVTGGYDREFEFFYHPEKKWLSKY